MHNRLLIVITITVIFCGLLTIAQIWGPVISWDNYAKIIITAVIVSVVCAFIILARGEMTEKEKMKDENYLD
ncbi:MAG: hypothetical protein KDI90_07395 [Alphaproteobacteria bacterium]|nr:hypothetical protein [Alphaproteobacteria bacterium]MCB9974959.1 hypothetical protein [Rhodospirillales bacterium]